MAGHSLLSELIVAGLNRMLAYHVAVGDRHQRDGRFASVTYGLDYERFVLLPERLAIHPIYGWKVVFDFPSDGDVANRDYSFSRPLG